MNTPQFSFGARAQSFRHAWQGLRAVLQTEHNTYIHSAFSIAVVIAGAVLRINTVETCLIVVAMALVWMAELFNTAVEKTADLISKERHPQIKLIKDVAAAAVLVAAFAALCIGCFIFVPKLF